MNAMIDHPFLARLAAWSVHLFTAMSGIFVLLSLYAMIKGQYQLAFLWLVLPVLIDSVDGTLARATHVKTITPSVDGALLDNLMDFLSYVFAPVFFLWIHPELLPHPYKIPVLTWVLVASAYQFTQIDAKTSDHFFKGFPCYWNFVAFYLFLLNFNPFLNAFILVLLGILVFLPIKYIYPSRLDYVSHHLLVRRLMLWATIVFGMANVGLMLLAIPIKALCLGLVSMATPIKMLCITYLLVYLLIYFGFSLYRTIHPLKSLEES